MFQVTEQSIPDDIYLELENAAYNWINLNKNKLRGISNWNYLISNQLKIYGYTSYCTDFGCKTTKKQVDEYLQYSALPSTKEVVTIPMQFENKTIIVWWLYE